MSEEMELEGEWVMGWPDRKRARVMPSKDSEGRTIFARSPVLDLEGVLTPTDAYYVIAQLNMPEPVHPDDFSFSIISFISCRFNILAPLYITGTLYFFSSI